METRKQVPKKMRFEVFKRDSFTCQYCGRKSPDVLLQVDHIQPVSKGGINEILNLITSCVDCNLGKSDRVLSDDTVLKKQRDQLELLQERKEQIEMMFEWQKGLLDIEESIVNELSNYWSEIAKGFSLNENGKANLKKLTKKFSSEEIIYAMQIASEQYLKFEDGTPTKDSVEFAWKKIAGICVNKKREKENPNLPRLLYIRGIARKRFSYMNEYIALELLTQAYELNASIESMEKHVKIARNWTEWRCGLETFIEEQKQNAGIKENKY